MGILKPVIFNCLSTMCHVLFLASKPGQLQGLVQIAERYFLITAFVSESREEPLITIARQVSLTLRKAAKLNNNAVDG